MSMGGLTRRMHHVFAGISALPVLPSRLLECLPAPLRLDIILAALHCFAYHAHVVHAVSRNESES
jgi:hypothetical protein